MATFDYKVTVSAQHDVEAEETVVDLLGHTFRGKEITLSAMETGSHPDGEHLYTVQGSVTIDNTELVADVPRHDIKPAVHEQAGEKVTVQSVKNEANFVEALCYVQARTLEVADSEVKKCFDTDRTGGASWDDKNRKIAKVKAFIPHATVAGWLASTAFERSVNLAGHFDYFVIAE